MKAIAIVMYLMILTFLFIIIMFGFGWGENFEKMFENVFVLKWFGKTFWNIVIPVLAANLLLIIWLVIEWIKFDPNEPYKVNE